MMSSGILTRSYRVSRRILIERVRCAGRPPAAPGANCEPVVDQEDVREALRWPPPGPDPRAGASGGAPVWSWTKREVPFPDASSHRAGTSDHFSLRNPTNAISTSVVSVAA